MIMLKRSEIRVRDPYIVLENDTYYLYATTGDTTLSYYTSSDLENWESGGIAFEIPKDFWAYKDVWAAEVHKYNGKFYLFVSLLGKNNLRGTQIAVSDTPAGPFVPLCNAPATPADRSCIDGTLFVDNKIPYIFYSHDWPDCYNADKDCYIGQICVAKLSEDLTSIIGEPKVLFNSNQSPISNATPDQIVYEGIIALRYGSDAPFVQRLSNGSLLLTWSPYLNDNYVVLSAISKNGDIMGPWEHLDVPLFDNNGGHAMFLMIEGDSYVCAFTHLRHLCKSAPVFLRSEKRTADLKSYMKYNFEYMVWLCPIPYFLCMVDLTRKKLYTIVVI